MLRHVAAAAMAGALVAASAVLGVVVAPVADAATPRAEDYSVTFVARVCPTYGDIMANRARNNIQESLRDLGKDTVYGSGQPVSPSVEEPNNPNCHPLNDWQFALGTGYTGKTPANDYLSTVTGDYGQTIRVQPKTAELDALGQPTGRTVKAAVTVVLTADQARRAQGSNSLWTQGGTKADPLLHSVFGDDYGFGALRCAIDNLNGDNVEWIGFPSGARHVFCYYYAVQPPPSAGTIIVRKSLETGSNGPAQFRYVGNISYTTTNDFTLSPQSDTSPASATFIRAAGDSWDFEEQAAPGYQAVSLTCAQTTPPVAGPNSTWTITGRKAVVQVGDGATVRCDYVNRDSPPTTGRLTLNKVTFGGVGSFPFRITDPNGVITDATGTTTTEGELAPVSSAATGATGTWTARETLPAATTTGAWEADSAQCNGDALPLVTSPGPGGTTYATASRTIAANETVECTFANTFVPGGELQITKRTTGGVGGFAFPVIRGDQADADGHVSDLFTVYGVRTTAAGTTATAAPLTGQTALRHLPVGAGAASTYYITELSAPDTNVASWRPTSVTCSDIASGASVPVTVYRNLQVVSVQLTDAHPRVRCLAVNALQPVGHLDVAKTIVGSFAGLQDAVRVAVTCDDGTRATLAVPDRATGTTRLDPSVVIRDATSCTVAETATGENARAPLTYTTVSVDGAEAHVATSAVVPVSFGRTSSAVVTDLYGALPPTGVSSSTGPLALLGLVLLVVGSAVYVAAARR